jgi:hypothetical protein
MKADIVLKKWKKNPREQIRVMLNEYNGRWYISVRSWYLAEDGTYRPGSKGINLSVDHVHNLFVGMRKARRNAKRLGLLG